jgi:hypothetical protein
MRTKDYLFDAIFPPSGEQPTMPDGGKRSLIALLPEKQQEK